MAKEKTAFIQGFEMNILVLYGGDSPEREVSLSSGKTIAEASENAGFNVILFDTKEGFEGIEKIEDIDYVLPILHGVNGEDGEIQAYLEKAGLRFLGAGSKASADAFDKIKTHEILEKNGVRMPKYARVSLENINSNTLFSNPYVLKPIFGGSSLDTQIVREVNDSSKEEAERLLNLYPEMIIEELIDGKELTVPVLGNKSLDVIAIIPPENEEFNYENKYNDKTQEICPAPVDFVLKDIQNEARRIALEVHDILGIRHLSRTDFIVTGKGDIYTLELNTIPGLRPQSLFPKAVYNAGMSMEDLIMKFIELIDKE